MSRRGFSPKGKGELALNAKLKDEDIRHIRYLTTLGKTEAELANYYQVSPQSIQAVVRNKTWTHIEGPCTTPIPHILALPSIKIPYLGRIKDRRDVSADRTRYLMETDPQTYIVIEIQHQKGYVRSFGASLNLREALDIFEDTQ